MGKWVCGPILPVRCSLEQKSSYTTQATITRKQQQQEPRELQDHIVPFSLVIVLNFRFRFVPRHADYASTRSLLEAQ